MDGGLLLASLVTFSANKKRPLQSQMNVLGGYATQPLGSSIPIRCLLLLSAKPHLGANRVWANFLVRTHGSSSPSSLPLKPTHRPLFEQNVIFSAVNENATGYLSMITRTWPGGGGAVAAETVNAKVGTQNEGTS